MGASVSNIRRDIKKETSNILTLEGSKNVCTVDHAGITLSGLKGVTVGPIKITSRCEVESKTYFDAMIKALVKLSSKLDAKTKAALGISVSNLSESIEDRVENIIQAKCGGSIASFRFGKIEILDSEDSNFESIIIDSDGRAVGDCVINAIADVVSETEVKTDVKTEGSSLADILGNPLLIILGIVAIVIVGGGIAKYASSNNKKNSGSSGKASHGD